MIVLLTASPIERIGDLSATVLAAGGGIIGGIIGGTDPAVLGAYFTALTAIVSAVIAYFRGQRADTRSMALTELEAALKARAHDVDRLRDELEEAKRRSERMANDIATLTASVTRCEREKERIRRELSAEIESLRRLVARMSRPTTHHRTEEPP